MRGTARRRDDSHPFEPVAKRRNSGWQSSQLGLEWSRGYATMLGEAPGLDRGKAAQRSVAYPDGWGKQKRKKSGTRLADISVILGFLG